MRGRANAAFKRFAPIGAGIALCLLLANCTNSGNVYGVSPSPRVVDDDQPVPKGGGVYRVGAPYVVGGRVYVPEENPHYVAVGLASWYGEDFRGRMTANGEVFDHNGISAAHPTLPLPSYVRVTNLSNGRSLIVRVNDRGPYRGNRIIDVSTRAAHLLGFRNSGIAWVKVEYVGRAPLEGSDDRLLAATYREDEPAPPPSTVRLAATPIVPASWTPPMASTSSLGRGAHFASASANDAVPQPVERASAYAPPRGIDGTNQFLNGRGLY